MFWLKFYNNNVIIKMNLVLQQNKGRFNMDFLKTIIKNKRLVVQLGKNDFKNKFAGTSLGSIWGFVSPFIFMLTYVIVFQYILKTGSAGEYPYVVWFLPGMSMWMFINDSILSASGSIRNYSYLVKKVVFPVDIIPVISLTSTSIIGAFLFVISIVVCAVFGYIANFLEVIYFIVAAFVLIVSITRFTSAVSTLVPDFVQLLGVLMQLFFWFTPIVWNISMLNNYGILQKVMQCMPFTYLVNGFRSAFTGESFILSNHLIPTISFWVITILMFLWGNSVFRRSKKDFADVL